MNGSWKVRVVKRDGSEEPFDVPKLTGAMLRAMQDASAGRLWDARQLALAIGIYLRRCGRKRIASAAVLEMAVKVLRRSALPAVADAMESHSARRQDRRAALCIRHGNGKVTLWDKGWLARLAEAGWFLCPTTARILAADVERELLSRGPAAVSRREVLDLLNGRVAQYGLADAVPIRQPVGS